MSCSKQQNPLPAYDWYFLQAYIAILEIKDCVIFPLSGPFVQVQFGVRIAHEHVAAARPASSCSDSAPENKKSIKKETSPFRISKLVCNTKVKQQQKRNKRN